MDVTGGGALRRIVAFQEGLARRSAQRLITIPGGFAVLDNRYPVSYEHNRLYVTGPVAAEVLLAQAERVLRRRQHRQIAVLHDELGRRLAPGLLAAGYHQEHDLLMVLAGVPEQAVPGVAVERVPLAALDRAVARSWTEQYPDVLEAELRQLVERRAVTAAACELSSHAVRVDGEVVAWCHLYRVGGEAQVENVNTLPAWRGRGFAKAVVLDAVAAALEAGCDLVFLVADRDDWPQHLYERLGFSPAGEQHSFLRTRR
ncbi:MAG TPA: GNAT family N-acetyltransferase [Candidatus Dormibacteraeota bacterium]